MGDKDIFEILLSKGADVNVTNNDGMTSLHFGE
jgi:ankyrin repeat protein